MKTNLANIIQEILPLATNCISHYDYESSMNDAYLENRDPSISKMTSVMIQLSG